MSVNTFRHSPACLHLQTEDSQINHQCTDRQREDFNLGYWDYINPPTNLPGPTGTLRLIPAVHLCNTHHVESE